MSNPSKPKPRAWPQIHERALELIATLGPPTLGGNPNLVLAAKTDRSGVS